MKPTPLDGYSEEVLVGLKKAKSVLHIFHTNGTLQNLGCTPTTRQCNSGRHYDFQRHLRINNPPCCMAKKRELLEHFAEEFRRRNVTYALMGGEIMGWVRHGDFVPYDTDVDMMIDVNFWKSKGMREVIEKMKKLYKHDVYYHHRWKLTAY